MKDAHQAIAKDALSGIAKGSVIGAAGSIASGAAIAPPTFTILGWSVTIGPAAAVLAPVVFGAAAIGAVTYAGAAAFARYRKNKHIEQQFRALNGEP